MKKTILFLLLISLALSCTIKEPEAPEWDVELSIPLINKDYFVRDLTDTTDDYIIVDEMDTMRFSYRDTLDTVRVEDNLTIDGSSETFEELIGDELSINDRTENFSINVGDSLRISEQNTYFEYPLDKIEVEETGSSQATVYLLKFAQQAVGDTVDPVINEVVPPLYYFPPVDTTFTIFENDNVEYVTIDSGYAYVEFQNKSQLPISSDDPAHPMVLEIRGESPSGPLIIEKEIDHVIEGNTTENVTFNLAGRTVYRQNYLVAYLTTDGTGTETISVVDTSRFVVNLSVSEMVASAASAKLPSEKIKKERAISILDANNEVSISSATIDSCMAHIQIINNLPLDANLNLKFVEFYDETGNQFEYEQMITHTPPQNDFHLDLAGFEIHSPAKQTLDSLHFTYTVTTLPTDEYVEIDYSQFVSCDFSMEEMWFQQVTGKIIQDYEIEDEFDLSDDTEKITLEEAIFRSGTAVVNLSGLEFTPQLEITFDQLLDNMYNPLTLTNDDFSGYSFGENPDRVVVGPEQIVYYHAEVSAPDEIITISQGDQLQADIQLNNFVFEEVTGKFGSFTIEDTGATEVDSTGEYDLQYAEIESCDVDISIDTNPPLPVDCNVNLTFEEVFTESGNPLTLSISVPGDTSLSFAGHTIGASEASTEIIDSLHYTYEAVTDSSTETITLHYDDEINANIQIGDIIFNKVKGGIYNKSFQVDPQEQTIDLGDLPDSLNNVFNFTNAELKLDIFNGLDFNGEFNTTIYGFNTETGETAFILIQNEPLAANQQNTIIKPVSGFLNIIPDSIYVDTIDVVINGMGTVTKDDSVTGKFQLRTPLKFVINDKQDIKMDSLYHSEFDEDENTKIENNLNRVTAKLKLENSMPFGLTTYLYFASDSNLVWNEPELIIDSLILEPAIIDSGGNIPSTSDIDIVLSQEQGDLTVFTNPDVYIGTKFDILGTDGESVYIYGSDKINVRGAIKVKVHIDEELTEE
ncbi:MAG: hypothetical protein KGY75_01500 [Candidatus Cloacimonetes bacterium]|nr:hypothetical protein [Candidatus Cloacimonadota bacterium]